MLLTGDTKKFQPYVVSPRNASKYSREKAVQSHTTLTENRGGGDVAYLIL